MKRFVFAPLFALMLGVLAFGAPVAAQDATPVAPAPELCTLTPPTFEQLSAYAASPVAEVAEAEATPGAELALPEGTPVDDATREAVEQSMIVNVACFNAGSPLLQLAAYSDRLRASLVAGVEVDQAAYDSWATPMPVAEGEGLAIIEFQEMVLLADGRVAAIIVGDDESNDTSEGGPTLFYLTEQDGHWYIDDFVNPAG